jgi:hypothetical protein
MVEEWFRKFAAKWLDQVTGIKFRGGIVGRLNLVLLGILVVLVVICWKFPMWWIPFVALAGVAMVCYVLLQILDFAKKNPVVSLLEGSELLAWQKQAQKGKGTITNVESSIELPEPKPLDQEDIKRLELPDTSPDTKG